MRILFWQSVKSLVAAGLLGLAATTAQAYDQQPTRLPSFDEVYNLNEQTLFRGQTCGAAASCDSAGNCDGSADCCDDDCDCIGNWRDNTYVWFGGEAYKSIGDTGLNFNPPPFALGSSFGVVSGFNTGFAIGDSRIRGQIGGSFGVYDFKGRTLAPKNDSLENQSYMTAGIYKASDISNCERISWGVVYDAFLGHQYGWAGNEIFVSQIRYMAGYALNECNEIGFWGTAQVHDDDDVDLTFPIAAPRNTVHAMNQLNTYFKHNWAFGGMSTVYGGVFDKADIASWQFGLLNLAPVNHNLSVYANFTYVVPSSATGIVGAAEEQWNVSAGLVYYFGGKAVADTVSGHRGLPLLPVANNGNFLITN